MPSKWRNQINAQIAELEAENRIFRSTESVDDSVWDALLEQLRKHQDTIERMKALLPEFTNQDGSPTMCSASAAKKIRALLEKEKGRD